MKRDFRKWVLMVLTTLLLFSQPVKMMAQEETATTNQLWLFWQHNQYFTSRFKYLGDIGYRHEIPFENWRRMHFRPGIIDKTLYARLNAELYFDLGKSIIERFVNKGRLTTGLGYRFNPKWRLEMLYAIEQSTAFSEEGFNVNSHIIQIHLKTNIFRES
jgi:hypothetical protein